MFLRKLGKRGAEMVEYAIVLACIAAVGVGFYSSNDSKLTGVLDSLFGNVRQVLGLGTEQNANKLAVKDNAEAYEEALNRLFDVVIANIPEGVNPHRIFMKKNEDGTAHIEYYAYNPNYTTYKKDLDMSFLTDKGLILSSHSNFNLDSENNIIQGTGDSPTRIIFRDTNTNKEVAYLAYDAEAKKFYNYGKFFSNYEYIANNPLN